MTDRQPKKGREMPSEIAPICLEAANYADFIQTPELYNLFQSLANTPTGIQ